METRILETSILLSKLPPPQLDLPMLARSDHQPDTDQREQSSWKRTSLGRTCRRPAPREEDPFFCTRRFDPQKETPAAYVKEWTAADEARILLLFKQYLDKYVNNEESTPREETPPAQTPRISRLFSLLSCMRPPPLNIPGVVLTPCQAETQKQIDDLRKELLNLKFIVRESALQKFMATAPHEINEHFEGEPDETIITYHLLLRKFSALKVISQLDYYLNISRKPRDLTYGIYQQAKPYLEEIFPHYQTLVSLIDKALSIEDQLLSITSARSGWRRNKTSY